MSSSRRRLAFAAIVSIVGVACATSTSPLSGGGNGAGPGTDDDAGGNVAYAGEDGGAAADGAAVHTPPKDGGTVTPIDGGSTPPPVDSGTTPTNLCVGQTSTYENDFDTFNYDDWCDENVSHDNHKGTKFQCSDNSDCAGIFNVTACCYVPVDMGYCQSDYGNVSQCVPQ